MKHKKGVKVISGFLLAVLLLTQPIQALAMEDTDYGPTTRQMFSLEDSSAFSRLELRKGTLNGEVVANLLSAPDGWKLDANQDYYIYGEVKKPAGADSLQIRVGNGSDSFNGLTFFNPPGGTYTPGAITHDYFDKLTNYDAIPDPAYGSGNAKLALQDGTMTYHIKDQVGTNDTITFAMGLVVNDVAFGGASTLTDAVTVALGHMDAGSFVTDSSKTSSIDMNAKNRFRAYYSTTSVTALLDSPGAILTSYIGDVNANTPAAMLYDTLEWDIYYPPNAVLQNIGFTTDTFSKTNGTYGTLTTSAPVLENGQQKVHLTLTNGYKVKSSNLIVYSNFTFPSAFFKAGQQCKVNYANAQMTPKGGGTPIQITDVSTPAVYTILDTSMDYTSLSAMNRTEVYNHAIDSTEPFMVSLGSAQILNKAVSSPTPQAKTYEANFNITNTAAIISAVTVPLGTSATPVVTWYGLDAGGAVKSGTIANPEDYIAVATNGTGSLSTSKCLRLRASDFGIVTFTSVKADIGNLRPNYNSSGSSSSWDLNYNGSGAFGYFTTAETGIQVRNTFRVYNTDPALRNMVNGDLSITSTATSTSVDRMGFSSDSVTIKNSKGASVDSVAAGETVTIGGYVYPYSIPAGAKKDVWLATDALAMDPVVYLTLPRGLTYESLVFKRTELEFLKTSAGSGVVLPHSVENVSYLNKMGDGTSIFKISFPKGTTIGYYDNNGSRYLLNYNITLRTSKSMETKRYELNSLIGISTENQLEAMPYSSNSATLNTIMKDVYKMNGGKDYAGITKGPATAQPGFGLQQLAEINVYNAVSVTKVNGQSADGAWHTYDSSDPNSIASMGKNSEGQFRLNIQNTSDSDSGNLQAIIPIPKKGVDLGAAFMDGAAQFDLTMDIPQQALAAANYTAKYIKITGSISDASEAVTYSDSDATGANAILLTRDSVPARANDTFYFNFKVNNGPVDAVNIWRNVFQYTTSDNVTSFKNGSYVASAIAGSSINGTVFEDKNRNGIQDSGEPGVAGATVVVKDDQNKILSAVTDNTGGYTFQAVRNATLSMSFSIPASQGLRFNLPASEAADGSAVVPEAGGLGASKSLTANNAVETVNAAVSGYYTLSYQKNNAAAAGNVPVTGEYVAGDHAAVSVKPDNLLLTGYNFKEWNTAGDGSGTGYQPGQTLTIAGDTALFAIWEIGTYTLRFDYRGATNGNEISEKQLVHNQPYNTGGALPSPTRAGYSFGGWCATSTGTSAVGNATKFTLGADTTLYALWNAKTGYKVKYNTGGSAIADASVSWTASVLPAAVPSRTGYQFNGWAFHEEPVSAAMSFGELAESDASGTTITLDAQWAPKTGYTVKYNSDGADAVPEKIGINWTDAGLLPEIIPSKAGFAFGGWTLDNSVTVVTNASTYGELAAAEDISSITLKAVWNAISDNTVHYETGGGTVYPDKTGVTASDSGLIPAVNPTRNGYQFIGWMSGAATVTNSTQYSDLTSNSTVTVTANWKAKSYTIQYSEGGFSNVTKVWTDSGLTGGNIPVKDGSIFGGWYYENAKVTDSVKVSQLIPLDNKQVIVLQAKWVEDAYTVVYDSAGGTAYSPKTDVKYSSTGLLPGNLPVRTGYTFTGWYCGSTEVTTATTCGSLNAAASGKNITLQARWAEKTGYTVQYNSTGGTAVAPKNGVSWGGTGLLPSANPLRTGYTFKGWISGRTTVSAATTYGSIAASDTAGSSVTLVAQWAEASGYTVRYNTGAGTPVADKTGISWNSSNLIPLQNIAPGGFIVKGWTCGGITVTPSMTYGELAAISTETPIVLTAVYEPITGSDGNGVDVQGKVVEGKESAIYKIDLSWGSMKFEYSIANVWDPDTHSYIERMQGWTNEPFNGLNNKITAANHSNADVEVDFRAAVEDPEAMQGVTMEIRQQNRPDGALAESMLLSRVPEEAAAAPEISSYLWLIGTPENSSIFGRNDYSKFGVINVTIQSVDGTLTPRKTTP